MSEAGAPVMIAAGGTGGHIYPALAVAAEMRRRGRTLLWLGNPDGMEAQIGRRHGYEFLPLAALPLRGQGMGARLRALGRLFCSVLQALSYMHRHKPALVLGMGGYVSAAGSIAAWLWRVPLCLHEQNAIPGLVNRCLAPFATVVMEAYEGSFSRRQKVQHTGNPVRVEFVATAARTKIHTPPSILLLGGSQGASLLNDIMPRAWVIMRRQTRLQLRHQAGAFWESQVNDAYDDAAVQVDGYIDDMAAAVAAADLVICRGGAMTLTEVAAAGLPAVVVPYRAAADNHQHANALWLERAGAARLLPEQECSPERLSEIVLHLLAAPDKLAAMSVSGIQSARGNAAGRITDLCLEAAYG